MVMLKKIFIFAWIAANILLMDCKFDERIGLKKRY